MDGKRVYYLYLSTLITTGNYACDKTNLACAKWNIDWSRIFPADVLGKKDCMVKIKLISEEVASGTLTYDANLGTVRANFSSQYQNSNNGVILGQLTVIDSPSAGTSLHVLNCDTTIATSGVRIKVPNNSSYFNVCLFNLSETALTSSNLNDYQIEFHFEIIE